MKTLKIGKLYRIKISNWPWYNSIRGTKRIGLIPKGIILILDSSFDRNKTIVYKILVKDTVGWFWYRGEYKDFTEI